MDPAATSYGPRIPKALPVYLTVPEWTRLLRKMRADPTLTGQRDYAIMATFLYCGLRCAELALLRRDQVRLEDGWLRVRGKGNKEREVPIPQALAPTLRQYLANVRPQLVADFANPYVFTPRERPWEVKPGQRVRPGADRRGEPLRTRTVYWIVTRRVAMILGRKLSPHKLRHSFATRFRRAGGDLQLVQELLGHADIGTTMVYSTLGRRRGEARWTACSAARNGGRRRMPGLRRLRACPGDGAAVTPTRGRTSPSGTAFGRRAARRGSQWRRSPARRAPVAPR